MPRLIVLILIALCLAVAFEAGGTGLTIAEAH